MTRSSAFFHSDVMGAAEEMVYPLAADYGLSDEDRDALVDELAHVTTEHFATVRDRDAPEART